MAVPKAARGFSRPRILAFTALVLYAIAEPALRFTWLTEEPAGNCGFGPPVLIPGCTGRGEAEVSVTEFLSLADAVRPYIDVARDDQLMRGDVANTINGLTEFSPFGGKTGAARVLSEADRLECLFFGGFDPHFEGDEPPGM